MERSSSRVKGAVFGALVLVALLAGWAACDGFQFLGPLSRVLTPNASNGANPVAIFCFYNPSDSGVSGEVYTLLGRRVAPMTQQSPALAGCPANGTLNPQSLTWDGRSNGIVVHSGVYVYEISSEGHNYTGTVVVVR